jgi:hypothetical protein
MKLHLTYAEAVAVITRQLLSSTHDGQPVEVIIGRPESKPKVKSAVAKWPRFFETPANDLVRGSMQTLMREMSVPGGPPNKITAIKSLRELAGLGLYESKCIIESYWAEYLAAAIRLNRWPHVEVRSTSPWRFD